MMKRLRRAVAVLILPLVASCTYGQPQYRGTIDNAVLLAGGTVAVAYHQWLGRPPTGLSTFPDGGAPLTLHDASLVALVAPDGRTRELARIDNFALREEGHLGLAWYKADPNHLYVTRSGYNRLGAPFREQFRMNLKGQRDRSYDVAAEIAHQGSTYGSKEFGGERVVSPDGTMLIGAMRRNRQELWLRMPDGTLKLVDQFDRFEAQFGDELVYSKDDVTFARSWRTRTIRPILRFNRSTMQSERLAPDSDPVIFQLRHRKPEPNDQVWPSPDGKALLVYRDNELVREVHPDARILDRI